jgi:hypothetical protein
MHRWDSGTGHVSGGTGTGEQGGRTLSASDQIRSLAGSHPGEDLGHARQYTTRNSQTLVKIQLFSSPTAVIHKGIEAEAERLSDFFKTNVVLEYEHLSSSGS